MTLSSKSYIPTTLLLIGSLTSLGQSEKLKTFSYKVMADKIQKIDTSLYTIIPFKQSRNYIFDSTYTPATLTKTDLEKIDLLLTNFVDKYNKDLSGNNKQYFTIDFEKMNYKRQYIAVINDRGEKEVWINCLCSTHGDNWKTNVVMVMDGGSCFFNLKINLTKGVCYDLYVNGVA